MILEAISKAWLKRWKGATHAWSQPATPGNWRILQIVFFFFFWNHNNNNIEFGKLSAKIQGEAVEYIKEKRQEMLAKIEKY